MTIIPNHFLFSDLEISSVTVQSTKPCAVEETSSENLTSGVQSLKLDSYNGFSYPSFFINVFAESDLSHQTDSSAASYLYKDLGDFPIDSGTPASGELYEHSIASHGDKTFMKFKKQIAKCPSQIIRYVFFLL